MDPLDRPVWNALTTRQAHLAVAAGTAVRIDPRYGPFAAARGPVIDAEVVADLVDQGLVGIEVDHPDQDPETRARLRELAAELDLVPTGSSDYHGTNKTIRIGQETTAPESLERLAERATGSKIIG